MIVAALALLAATGPSGVELTPAALIDDLTARYGYAALGTSVAEPKGLTVPDPANLVDVATRMKTRWRVVPDRAMPGAFRTVAARYDELFEERGPEMPTIEREEAGRLGDKVVQGRSFSPAGAPKPAPAPEVELADLARPGGVRVSAERLGSLLGVKPEEIPWVYRRLTATVRLDPARPVRLLALLAAITEGTLVGERLRIEPLRLRPLAAETLRMEAARGVRSEESRLRFPDAVEEEAGRSAARARLATFERARPLRLRFGAEVHEATTDDELRRLYARPNGGMLLRVPGLERKFPEVWRGLTSGPETGARPIGAVIVDVPTGLGRAVLDDRG